MSARVVEEPSRTTSETVPRERVVDDTTATTTDGVAVRNDGRATVVRLVWFLAGVLLVLLAFRFVFALIGANPSNGFANFIYSVSHPFVAPFFSLFSYRLQYGVSRFEIYTLVAMAVYALIAFGIARLLVIDRPRAATRL